MQQDVKLVRDVSPYIRKEWTSRRVMIDVLIALIPVVVFAIYRFGHHSLIRMIVGVLAAVLAEALVFPLSQKVDRKAEGKLQKFLSRYKTFNTLNIFTAAVTGLILALQLPAQINIYVVVMGAFFAIIIGKMVFGGTGNNIFNPAVLGRVFVALAFGTFFQASGIYPGIDAAAGATPLTALKGTVDGQTTYFLGQTLSSYSLLDLFIGNVPGSMGEISALAILLGAAYLIIRRAADWKTMLAVIAPVAVLAVFAGLGSPHVANGQILNFVLFHVLSGGLIFGAVFMATDPVTSPLHISSKLLFGLLIASLTMLNRLFGPMPEGVAFSILFANMLVPSLDRIRVFKNRFTWQFGVTYGVAILVMILIVFFGVGGAF